VQLRDITVPFSSTGKKLMTVRIVKHAFEIIHLLSGENPLQV
jgi:small subunit ribosomal protein S5e